MNSDRLAWETEELRFSLSIIFAFAVQLHSQDEPSTKTIDDPRVRARDKGIQIGEFETGKWNAITDVPGVKVGHTTLHQGKKIHTGVTAILPHEGNLFQEKVPAAIIVGKRALHGMARTGSSMSNGSGDYVISFSTAYRIPNHASGRVKIPPLLGNDHVSLLFAAAMDATEEAILNSMFMATTIEDHRGTAKAIDRNMGE